MKYSFFDLWGDGAKKPEDLPKHYETSYDYRNSTQNSGEGWFEDERPDNFNFDFSFSDDEDGCGAEQEEEYPECVFGLKKSDSQEDMKKAYREAMLNSHPDKGGDPEEFRKYREAWEDYRQGVA